MIDVGRSDVCPFWADIVKKTSEALSAHFPSFQTQRDPHSTTIFSPSFSFLLLVLIQHVFFYCNHSFATALNSPCPLLSLWSIHQQNFSSGWTQLFNFSRLVGKQMSDGKNKIAPLENLGPFWIHVLRPQVSTQDCSKAHCPFLRTSPSPVSKMTA